MVDCIRTCVQLPEGCGYVRTVVPSSRGGADGLLYVGTTKNSVLHGSLQDKMATVIHVSSFSFQLPSFRMSYIFLV